LANILRMIKTLMTPQQRQRAELYARLASIPSLKELSSEEQQSLILQARNVRY